MKENAHPGKIAQSVADFYETYGTAFSRSRKAAWGVMNLVRDAVRPGMTVIDVGAGNARLADALPLDVRYVAIEPSSTLRAEAVKRLSLRDGAEVREGSFSSVPAQEGEGDVVASIAVLHHLASAGERRRAVKELARVTKRGGTAIVTVWNLRSRRMFSWKAWAAAWLRLSFVAGGESGDVWVPWNEKGKIVQRFVHAFTLNELRALFDERDWHIQTANAWQDDAPSSILDARNLVVVAKRT